MNEATTTLTRAGRCSTHNVTQFLQITLPVSSVARRGVFRWSACRYTRVGCGLVTVTAIGAVELLNSAVPWDHLGFVVDGRFLFSQRTLATAMLPDAFRELQKPTLVRARSRVDAPVRRRKAA